MSIQSQPRRRRVPPAQVAQLGEALRDVYPEDHESDLAMLRAIRMLDDMTAEGLTFAEVSTRTGPA